MRRKGNYKFLDKFTHYVPGIGGMFALLAWLLVGALLGGIVVVILSFALGADFVAEYGALISYPVMFIPPMVYASNKSATNAMSQPGWKLDSSHFAPLGAVKCIILALIVTVALSFWTDALVCLLPDMPPALKAAMEQLTQGSVWVNFLSVSIFAPVCEEWLCRGMVLRGLLQGSKIKPVWAIVISAVFFALIHMNPWQAIPAFIMGCIFGLVYYRTGSLKLTMFMHFANNTMALAIGHIDALKDVDNWKDIMPLNYYILTAVACFMLTVLVVLAYMKIKPQRPEGSFDEVPSLFEAE